MRHKDVKSDFQILQHLLGQGWFKQAFSLQIQTQRVFHRMASQIAGASCRIARICPAQIQIERNFFSTFFLVVTRQMVGDSPYLPLYAMVNQAMRAWVTACDNILDDEYKEVLPFAFAGQGGRMRSILTLLIADRVLTEYVADHYSDLEMLRRIGRVSLDALASSALQECEEEDRPVPILPSRKILAEVHQHKTGDLFRAPLAMPEALETIPKDRMRAGHTAAEQFGLACQIIDDIKDMPADVQTGRHSLPVSLAVEMETLTPETLSELRREVPNWEAWDRFPAICDAAWQLAQERFSRSFEAMAQLGVTLSSEERIGIVRLMGRLLRVPLPATMNEETLA
jgi:hypothetical protein